MVKKQQKSKWKDKTDGLKEYINNALNIISHRILNLYSVPGPSNCFPNSSGLCYILVKR